jgi:hypothetical protein
MLKDVPYLEILPSSECGHSMHVSSALEAAIRLSKKVKKEAMLWRCL